MGMSACLKCGKNRNGSSYTIYVGKNIRRESDQFLSVTTTTSTYKDLGPEYIHLCDQCVNTSFVSKLILKFFLSVILFLLALFFILESKSDVFNLIWMSIPALLFLISAFVLIGRKEQLAERMAVRVYQKQNRSWNGVDTVWTSAEHDRLKKVEQKRW